MSAGFSSGPWEADGLSVKVSGRGVIANIPTPQNGGVMECVANANLIAAAPELYEALQYVLRRHPYYTTQVDALNRAEAALAKVRGQQVQS